MQLKCHHGFGNAYVPMILLEPCDILCQNSRLQLYSDNFMILGGVVCHQD